jgi:hypothetical protein
MTSNSIRKYLITAAITVACSSAALGQNKSTEGIDWMQELKSRITINGYMQGGYEYSDKGGNTTSSFNFKRAIFWGRARITDRWSFMFMNNFALSKGVLEFWTDYRITNNKALTVRVGQFQHPFSMESPLTPVMLELIDITSQSVTNLANGYEPLLGPNYGRDQGIMLLGDLFNDHFHYELAVMNGQGINTADGNSDKDVILKLEYRPSKEFRLVASGQKGRGHAVNTVAWNDIAVGDDYRRDRVSFGGELKVPTLLGRQSSSGGINLRSEFLAGKDGDVSSRGAYLTGSVALGKGVDVIASADYYDRNTSTSGWQQTNVTGGVQYWFYPKCRLQLQYTHSFCGHLMGDDYNRVQAQVQVAF